jgi:beta-lactamase regulating signal transducer with metallopeptidase domain
MFLMAFFLLFLAGTGFSFYHSYFQGTEISQHVNSSNAFVGASKEPFAGNGLELSIVNKDFAEDFIEFMNSNALLVVQIWSWIIALLWLRMITHALYARSLRRRGILDAPPEWMETLNQMCIQLGISKKVLLMESKRVSMPLMVGYFKPVILFPVSLISQLPPCQIEAVLLHELAHILRKDYLVNQLQQVAEMIFFFNPGLLWVSSLMRDEREHCCDELAIRQTGNRKEYVHALISFQEYRISAYPAQALYFPGRKFQLLSRVQRILTNQNKTLNHMEKVTLSLAILFAVFMGFAFNRTDAKQQDGHKKNQNLPIVAFMKDTVPDEKEQDSVIRLIKTNIDGKKYRIREVNGEVTEIYINGEKVPNEKFGEYKEILESQKRELMEKEMKVREDELEIRADQTKLLAEDKLKMLKDTEEMKIKKLEMNEDQQKKMEKKALAENQNLMQDKILEQELLAKKFAEDAAKSNLMSSSEMLKDEMAALQRAEAELKQESVQLNSGLSGKNLEELKKSEAEIDEKREMMNKKMEEIEMRLAERQVKDAGKLNNPEESRDNDFVSWPLSFVIDDLLSQGIIQSRENIDLILNKKMLKVNGIVQPEALHQEYVKKYLKNLKNHVIYSRHGLSISSDIRNGN